MDDSATLLEIRDLLREILVELRTERPKRTRRKTAQSPDVSDLDRTLAPHRASATVLGRPAQRLAVDPPTFRLSPAIMGNRRGTAMECRTLRRFRLTFAARAVCAIHSAGGTGENDEMKFSGHETFPCRYAWLPKAVESLADDEDALSADDAAMACLGLGKNMVKSLRFWLQVTNIAEPCPPHKFKLMPFGRALLDAKRGYDPYLEDRRTIWLLHWVISTQTDPLFAWDFLLNRWPHPEFSRSEVLAAFKREASGMQRRLSDVTLGQHLEVFLRSYLPPKGRSASLDEDVIDCPFAGLELIMAVGERREPGTSRNEQLLAFRREPKPDISAGLFAYCLDDFWTKRHPSEQTLSLRSVATGHGSPGQVFKLPEDDVRDRLEQIETTSSGFFTFRMSVAHPVVSRNGHHAGGLEMVYPERARHD